LSLILLTELPGSLPPLELLRPLLATQLLPLAPAALELMRTLPALLLPLSLALWAELQIST
jgi:hypothetical protein